MDVSIFIRARNEEKFIKQCLESVLSQKTSLHYEVILLDSQSNDETLEAAQQFPIRIYQIPKGLFSYSKALNLGIELSRGKLFVPLSAHCIPKDQSWLEELVEPLVQDDRYGASYSRQIPWPEASPPECESMQNAFPETERVMSHDALSSQVVQADSLYSTLSFSNASSCIRKTLLQRKPFRELPFSEDRAFAFDCLQEQLLIKYCPRSVVYHSHYPSFKEFRNVALQATIAQSRILVLAEKDSSIQVKGNQNFGALELMKFFLITPYALLLILKHTLTCSFCRLGAKKYNRLVLFYLSSIGTTFGKCQGLLKIRKEPPSYPTVADYQELKEQMKEVKR